MLPLVGIILIVGVLVLAGFIAFKGRKGKLGERDSAGNPMDKR